MAAPKSDKLLGSFSAPPDFRRHRCRKFLIVSQPKSTIPEAGNIFSMSRMSHYCPTCSCDIPNINTRSRSGYCDHVRNRVGEEALYVYPLFVRSVTAKANMSPDCAPYLGERSVTLPSPLVPPETVPRKAPRKECDLVMVRA